MAPETVLRFLFQLSFCQVIKKRVGDGCSVKELLGQLLIVLLVHILSLFSLFFFWLTSLPSTIPL